ncbi:MAG: DNA repair protein RadC [Butyrivibrio sp.]|jgi:DNA repair protein RadC|nr:DNA repair protein RadC [Butyrivibrio sp.]
MDHGTSLKKKLQENESYRSSLPYERFMLGGAKSLTEEELLAIIIRTGTRNATPMEIAQKVLTISSSQEHGLNSLYHVSLRDLMKIEGIGEVKAVKLKCIAELSRRMASDKTMRQLSFTEPETIAAHYMEQLRHEEKEKVMLISLNNRMKLIDEKVISIGTVNSTLLSSRDIYIHALKQGAVNILILHNHPGGDPSPSGADLCITDKIRKAGQLLDIKLLDHIIIGDHSYVSFKEKKLL